MPEYGPYEQPGWPSTLPYFKPAETFRNAFLAGQEINRRKQALENQMMAMSLRAQQNDINNQIKVAEYERRLEQGNARLEMMQQGVNTRDMIANWRMDKDKEAIEDIGNLATGLGNLGLERGDPKTPNAIMGVLANNSRALNTRQGQMLARQAFNTYQTDAKAVNNKLDSDYNVFIKQVKDTIGRGQSSDLDLLNNPEAWRDEYKDKAGGLHTYPVDKQTGQEYPEGKFPDWAKDWTKTDTKYVIMPDAADPKVKHYIRVPAKQLTDMANEWKALQQRLKNRPSLKIPDEYQEIKDLPADRSQWEVGQKYNTRMGVGTWNGHNFDRPD